MSHARALCAAIQARPPECRRWALGPFDAHDLYLLQCHAVQHLEGATREQCESIARELAAMLDEQPGRQLELPLGG